MRRWLLWTVGTVLVAVIVLAGLALYVGRPETQFAFLEGRKPTNIKPRNDGFNGSVYSYQANYEQTVSTARRELRRAGYEELLLEGLRERMTIFRRKLDRHEQVPDEDGIIYGEGVTIHNNVRGSASGYKPAAGWITVEIARRPRNSLFDRIRRWLGL